MKNSGLILISITPNVFPQNFVKYMSMIPQVVIIIFSNVSVSNFVTAYSNNTVTFDERFFRMLLHTCKSFSPNSLSLQVQNNNFIAK